MRYRRKVRQDVQADADQFSEQSQDPKTSENSASV
jgi:hypothetical protein